MEPKKNPSGVFPHSKFKPSSIHISQQSQDSPTGSGMVVNLTAPLTPRIDISRASSSSMHEDSSPENVFEQVGQGTLQDDATGCLGLFQEEVDELRSSTEELYFMEKAKGQTEREKPLTTQVPRAPMIFKFDDSQALQQAFNRKDSGSSEVAAFLNISGRTSRISSIGSQGSAVSRLSGVSGISRSPSPHRMLVETSFCGPKPIEPSSHASSVEQLTADMLENVILARRGDPTKASLAEGIEMKTKSTSKPVTTQPPTVAKDKVNGTTSGVSLSAVSAAEAAKAAAKEARLVEIKALKTRLNALNTKQMAGKNSGVPKKVVGITPEGTEYFRIKLKPDHLYDDKGLSPNERIIEDSAFKENQGKRKNERKVADTKSDSLNQISKISPTVAENRSPSPASASVSRKSSFCSFFKSKESNLNTEINATSKVRSSSATSGKVRLNEKSPLPSPSKCFISVQSTASAQEYGISAKGAHQSRQPLNLKDVKSRGSKPRLRYYETPMDGKAIHIPLHTPPEEKEKEFQKLKKKEPTFVIPPPPPIPPTRGLITNKPRKAPTAKIEQMQSCDEIEVQGAVDKRKPSADPSLWSVEVQRHSSQESQETVISSHVEGMSKNERTFVRPAIPAYINTINENPLFQQQKEQNTITRTQEAREQLPPTNVVQQVPPTKARNKKHILFSTRIGSGSEEQIFCTQLSLSKTESQSSQLSEQTSVFESPKNEEPVTKIQEFAPKKQESVGSISRNEKSSSSDMEKVMEKPRGRQRSDQSPDSVESRSHSVTRKSPRDSGDFSRKRDSSEEASRRKRDSSDEALRRKRDSSDEALRRKRDSGENKESQSSHSRTSPVSIPSQHSQTSLKQQKPPHLPEQSVGIGNTRMDISSESDEIGSDLDTAIHKRVSRIMEDHESTGLVLQESFDDELPYVPVTLPEERSSGLRIIPTKDRTQNELMTIPVERPRSTTPINPSSLDNYCERKHSDASEGGLVRGEKLRISLPKQKAEQTKEKIVHKGITRRISNLSNKSWTEFAEQNIPDDVDQLPPPPALPPRKSLTNKWIDFENIPEKRQPPKKITTIPSSSNKDQSSDKIHASKSSAARHYVAPEDCQCDCHHAQCHESSKRDSDGHKQSPVEKTPTSEDSQPLLDDRAERNSMMSTDSSMDCSLENDETNFLLQQSSTSSQPHAHSSKQQENSLDKPFGMDLSVEFGGHSNRSSISQDIKSPDVISHK
ncbi:unnamed protein product [Diamesa serratosioi]